MVFIVPDTFLENYTCSVCYKYLSVIPVKICRKKNICGRCVKNESSETDSMYNKIAVGALFKCVNQYDGCRSILPVNQVEAHEKICKSKVHVCPLCPEAVNLETYLFIQHFRRYHKNHILEKCYFELEMDNSLYQHQIYLYKSKNNLFFVKVQIKSATLTFTISALRDENLEEIYQRFRIICVDSIIETNKKLVLSVTKSEGNSFIISRSLFIKGKLHVLFELESSGVTKVIEESGEPSTLKKNNSVIKIDRKVAYKLQISKSEVNIRGKIFVPFCFVCSDVICIDDENDLNYIMLKDRYIYVCLHCLLYIKRIKSLDYWIDSEDSFTTSCSRILYYCQWECGTACYSEELLFHEINCINQPTRKCPFNGCDFMGKLNYIERHFDSTHKTNENDIYVYTSFVLILPNVEMYVWLKGYFVIIKFTFSTDFFNLKIDYRGLPKQMTLVIVLESGRGYYVSGLNGTTLRLNLSEYDYDDILNGYAKIIIREETDNFDNCI